MLTKIKQKILPQWVLLKSKLGKLTVLKRYIPAMVIVLVLFIGLIIGKKIASISNQPVNIPKPAALPTTTNTLPIDSNLTSLKQSILQLNPQLPDPIMPEFNNEISIEEIED